MGFLPIWWNESAGGMMISGAYAGKQSVTGAQPGGGREEWGD